MQAIIYKGNTITEETEPWARLYAGKVKVNSGEDARNFNTVHEAMEYIDELETVWQEYQLGI
jgi:hypothetical protein